jgi:hypothetical protein
MPHRCQVCDSPALPDGAKPVDIVNRLLQQKVALREIKRITGFDKSLVSRHSIRCVTRAQAGQIKSWFFKAGDTVHVFWPGRAIPSYLGPNDWLVRVSYDKDTDQPTKMLTREEATALQLQMKTANTPKDKSESESEETARKKPQTHPKN